MVGFGETEAILDEEEPITVVQRSKKDLPPTLSGATESARAELGLNGEFFGQDWVSTASSSAKKR